MLHKYSSLYSFYSFLFLLVCGANAQTLKLQFVQNAIARAAACNDASPAAYYFYPGSGTGSNTWVIHQEGGWWCWDSPSCLSRAAGSPDLVSSKNYPPTMAAGGIFSGNVSENPSFYNANLVYIKYCTSDVWSGTHIGNGNFSELPGWHFLGKFVIKAVIEDLVNMGMNSTASEILFTGCSAGGNGVFVNSDFVRSILPFTPNKFIAFSDAGWLANFAYTYTSFFDQYQAGFPVWGGVVNQLCTYANQFSPYVCYFGAIVQPYTQTPTITHIEQYDNVQFEIDCNFCNFNFSNPADVAALMNLRYAIFSSVLTVQPPHAVFSPACAHHCSSLDQSFNAITVGGVSLQQFLTKYWDQGSFGNAIDTCSTLNCSGNCDVQ